MARWPLLAALLLAACASAPLGPPVASDIFVLMGQSNMSGRGALAEAPADYRTPDPRIRVYGNDGVWRPAVEPVDSAAGQRDAPSADSTAGVGPPWPSRRR